MHGDDAPREPNEIYLKFLTGVNETAAEWKDRILDVQEQIDKDWSKSLRYFQAALVHAHDFGAAINEEAYASQKGNDVYHALVRLHAQACLRASEILTLLRTGHADGAYARWRSLQETYTVGAFIVLEGSEVARRFLDHNVIKAWEDANDHRLNADPGQSISDSEFQALQQEVNALCEKYGDSFQGSYGWASTAVRRKRPELAKATIRLSHIEEHVGSDSFFAAEYRQASHSVHPSSKGVHFPLGLQPGSGALLSGPSTYGLFEAGFNSPQSLYKVTALLTHLHLNEDRLKYLDALAKLVGECMSAFVEAAKTLDNSLRHGR